MRQEVSPLGKLLDPIADKLMIDAAAIMSSQTREFPWWATGLLLVYRRHAQISVADSAGKATTVALAGAMILYLADGPRSGKPALYIALLPFGASLVIYARKFVQVVRPKI